MDDLTAVGEIQGGKSKGKKTFCLIGRALDLEPDELGTCGNIITSNRLCGLGQVTEILSLWFLIGNNIDFLVS